MLAPQIVLPRAHSLISGKQINWDQVKFSQFILIFVLTCTISPAVVCPTVYSETLSCICNVICVQFYPSLLKNCIYHRRGSIVSCQGHNQDHFGKAIKMILDKIMFTFCYQSYINCSACAKLITQMIFTFTFLTFHETISRLKHKMHCCERKEYTPVHVRKEIASGEPFLKPGLHSHSRRPISLLKQYCVFSPHRLLGVHPMWRQKSKCLLLTKFIFFGILVVAKKKSLIISVMFNDTWVIIFSYIIARLLNV